MAVALCLLIASSSGGAPESASASGLERLRSAAEAHPDDFDLAWALARQLVSEGRRREAIASLLHTVRRWPEHADASLLLGTLLREAESPAEALPHLERAVVLEPTSGPARLQLALALRDLGRTEEALAQLRFAGEIEPQLRSETLLLRGITRMEQGDDKSSLPLLREAIELDPDGEVGRSARLLLGPRASTRDRFRLEAYSGLDYDSNVILDSGSVPGVSSDRDDGVAVWGATFAIDPLVGERYGLTLGARVDGRDHFDLGDYDEKNFTGFLSTRLYGGPQVRWSLDGIFSHSRLDNEPYLFWGTLRPNVTAILGERLGLARLYGEVEVLEYEDDPLFSSLERDGIAFGAGVEHHVRIPGWRDAWGAWSFAYRRLQTQAQRDDLGFRGDYDHDRYQGGLEATLPLPWKLEAVARASLAGEVYHHANAVAQIFEPSSRLRKRRDLAFDAGVELVRPLTSVVDLALEWTFADRSSNVGVYAYDRHIARLQLRFRSF